MTTEAEWDRVLNINVKALCFLAAAANLRLVKTGVNNEHVLRNWNTGDRRGRCVLRIQGRA